MSMLFGLSNIGSFIKETLRAAFHLMGSCCLCGFSTQMSSLRPQCCCFLFGISALPAAALLIGGACGKIAFPPHAVGVYLTADGVEIPHLIDDSIQQFSIVTNDDETCLLYTSDAADE